MRLNDLELMGRGDLEAMEGEERREAASRLLAQSQDLTALCMVALDYVNAANAGERGYSQDVATTVGEVAERLLYKANADGAAALECMGA